MRICVHVDLAGVVGGQRRLRLRFVGASSGDDDDEDDFREGLIATPIATPAATPSGGAATSKEGGAASSGSKSDEVEERPPCPTLGSQRHFPEDPRGDIVS